MNSIYYSHVFGGLLALSTLCFAAITYADTASSQGKPVASIPTLDEMAGEWVAMKDVANPPAVHNFHDMLIVGYDLTSFACNPGDWLWHTAKNNLYPRVKLSIDGKTYPAVEFYCRTAKVTAEGPFAQAREFYGPKCRDFDAPVRIAYRHGCLKECISGAAFADLAIATFLGFSPSLDGQTLLRDPKEPRPFAGQLHGVRYRDRLYRVSANEKRVKTEAEKRP